MKMSAKQALSRRIFMQLAAAATCSGFLTSLSGGRAHGGTPTTPTRILFVYGMGSIKEFYSPLATTGNVTILPAQGDPVYSSSNVLQIDSFRNTDGFQFRNFDYDGLSLGELTDAFGTDCPPEAFLAIAKGHQAATAAAARASCGSGPRPGWTPTAWWPRSRTAARPRSRRPGTT